MHIMGDNITGTAVEVETLTNNATVMKESSEQAQDLKKISDELVSSIEYFSLS